MCSGLARAQSKLRRLNNLLDNVMYSSQVRMFTAWLRGVLNDRRKMIQDVLVDTTPEELNHILRWVGKARVTCTYMTANGVV